MPSPRYAREIPQRYRMEAGRCASCKTVAFPAKRICACCKGDRIDPFPLPDEGKLVTWTVIHSAPENFDVQTPYAIGIVELPDNIRVMAQIVDCDPAELKRGQRVRRMLRRISTEGRAGIVHYGYKFVLV